LQLAYFLGRPRARCNDEPDRLADFAIRGWRKAVPTGPRALDGGDRRAIAKILLSMGSDPGYPANPRRPQRRKNKRLKASKTQVRDQGYPAKRRGPVLRKRKRPKTAEAQIQEAPTVTAEHLARIEKLYGRPLSSLREKYAPSAGSWR
jgi:hypothetical protein